MTIYYMERMRRTTNKFGKVQGQQREEDSSGK